MKKILFAICLFLSFNANALKFETVPIEGSDITAILISGTFTNGDLVAFEKFMLRFKGRKVVVALDSPGGSIREGLEFGAYFFDNNLRVGIENKTDTKARCLSACALAYLAAKQKFFSKNSTLGVHMFYFKDEQIGGLKTRAVAPSDDEAMGDWIAVIIKFARFTKIHPEAMGIMLSTPSSSMYYFDRQQMEKYGAIYLKE